MTVTATASPRPVLTFEEEPHIYRVDGRIIPSVTQVIKDVWPEIWPWANEFAMERGRLVHKALHFYILGDLNSKSLSPYIAGYVAAGVRFLQESGFEIARTPEGNLGTETRMYSPVYDFAGTLDVVGTLDRKLSIIDFKTGEPGWAAGPQTAAYAMQWHELTGEIPRQRFGLQLFEDGTFKLIPFKDSRDDQADFLAALRVWQRRRRLAA